MADFKRWYLRESANAEMMAEPLTLEEYENVTDGHTECVVHYRVCFIRMQTQLVRVILFTLTLEVFNPMVR